MPRGRVSSEMMGWRLVEACVLTALVVGVLAVDLIGRTSWFVGVGVLVIVAVDVVGCLALAAAALRRLRRPAGDNPPPTIEHVASAADGSYTIAAFFAVFALVSLAIYTQNATPTRADAAFLVVPFACAAISVALAGGRFGIRLDGPTRRLVRWRGVQVGWRTYPIFERHYQIGPDAQVWLAETATAHTTTIHKPHVEVDRGKDADVIRLHAEQLAKALSIPIVDRTASEEGERKREAHELDLPLAAQLRLRGKTAERRPLPERTRLTLESDVLPWVVRVRPRGLRGTDVAAGVLLSVFVVLPSMIPALIITALVNRHPSIVVLPLAVLIAVAISWYALWHPILRAQRGTEVVQLSASGIRVVRSAPGTHSAGQLAAEQIEEIVVTHNIGAMAAGLRVVARGDGVSVAFGHGLESKDAIWLRDTAIAALAPQSIYR